MPDGCEKEYNRVSERRQNRRRAKQRMADLDIRRYNDARQRFKETRLPAV